jgi:uncharacterized protein (TIGR04255 family)
MPRKYANPPLIEAVCEFRLLPDSPWDLTVHGQIYEKIKKTFPHKEQRVVQEVELKNGPNGIEQEVRMNERSVFFTNDRNLFVQIGHHLLAVNCLKPYPHWEGFKPKIEESFDALNSSIDIKGLARIGYRTLNRIELPIRSSNLESYFEFYPFLGLRLPQNMVNFIVGCVLSFSDGRDLCKVQLTSVVPETTHSSSFLLDLDYYLAKSGDVSVANALEWVEESHEQVNNIFEGCITDSLREIFQEE